MSNHVGILNDAIGAEAAGKARTALRLAGYTIYKGDPPRADTLSRASRN